MSIVVAVAKGRRLVMASDTRESFGNYSVPLDNHRVRKIQKVGGAALGMAGWGLYQNLLDQELARKRPNLTSQKAIFSFFVGFWKTLRERYTLVEDRPGNDDNRSPFADLDSQFLVANRRGIFGVAPDMSVARFEKYFAIGSGASFAMGALHALYDRSDDPERLARQAVEAACAFDIYSGGDVEMLHLR